MKNRKIYKKTNKVNKRKKSIRKKKYRKKKSSNKNNKSRKNYIGGIRYVYCPLKNEIQFLPYNYPIYKNGQVMDMVYQGNQAGGQIMPDTCSDFKHNMLERQFGCRQPYWFPKCT